MSSLALLVGLVILISILAATVHWPSEKNEGGILTAIVLLSLAPILLNVFDVLMDRGAVVEYAGVKIDFSQGRSLGLGVAEVTVPANIGVRGAPVADSGTIAILDVLKQATATYAAVVDLESGDAWWETRLLVLLAGAVRLGKPEAIVFVATDAGVRESFAGWAYARDLLPVLVATDQRYSRSLQTARAVALQWELAEPTAPGQVQAPSPVAGPTATRYQWMAFDPTSGLHKLQSLLGETIEQTVGSRPISLIRLEELFRPILMKGCIERSLDPDRQLEALFAGDAPFLAITEHGVYQTLASRLALLEEVLKSLVEGDRKK